MRRGRILIFILLIVVVGLVVAFVALRTLLQPAKPQTPTTVQVYVAGQNIPQGGKITQELLTTITLSQDQVAAVEYTTDEQADLLNNKVAKFPLDQGVIITSSMVTDASQAVAIAGPQWAALIPPGMTAISIPISRLSLASYGIDDGAHVNVNACFLFVDVDPAFQTILPNKFDPLDGVTAGPNITIGGDPALQEGPIGRAELDPSFLQPFYIEPNEPQRPRPSCQALFQNVVVMKRGNFQLTSAVDAAAAQTAQQQQQQGATPPPDVVTLIVSPQDAVTLSYLVYTDAKIMLTLRNPSDQSRMATEAATLQFLLSQYNIPVPAKLPYALNPRIDALAAPALPNDIVTVQPAP
ncbi:MAG: hypothetical protein HYX49_05500 [Chloroflexi bacterium]|nr:hypothetical protein [Chloroflexota bacterium]